MVERGGVVLGRLAFVFGLGRYGHDGGQFCSLGQRCGHHAGGRRWFCFPRLWRVCVLGKGWGKFVGLVFAASRTFLDLPVWTASLQPILYQIIILLLNITVYTGAV